jgi:membrane protein required for colicin V production
MDNLTLFDISTIGFILFLGIKGILKGFVKELFGLIGIIGGIYIGSNYAHKFGDYINSSFLHLNNNSLLYLIGFLTIFILIWFVSSHIGSIVSEITNISGSIDKFLGFAISTTKIFLIISIMLYIVSNIDLLKERTSILFKDSMIYPIYLEYGSKIVKLDAKQMETINQNPSSMDNKNLPKINITDTIGM